MNRIKASIAKRNAGLQTEAAIASPEKTASRAVIEDDEEDPPEPIAGTSERKRGKAPTSRRVIDIDDSSEDERPRKADKGKGRATQASSSADTSSESEDARPSMSRNPKATASAKAGKKGKADVKGKGRETEEAATSASTDPEVKRLQALIVACGVRKQWKIEYAKHSLEADTSKAVHLRAILLELGMEPEELTLERAGEIKAQREMDKEAAELASAAAGVPGVASGTGRGASRASKTQANKRTRDELRNRPRRAEDDDDESSEDDDRTTKQADKRADKNMDAFLGMLGLGSGGAKPQASKSKGKSAKGGGRRLGGA